MKLHSNYLFFSLHKNHIEKSVKTNLNIFLSNVEHYTIDTKSLKHSLCFGEAFIYIKKNPDGYFNKYLKNIYRNTTKFVGNDLLMFQYVC